MNDSGRTISIVVFRGLTIAAMILGNDSGTIVKTGGLIHDSKHGFLIIPEEDQPRILEASLFMDNSECKTVINAAIAYKQPEEQQLIARQMNQLA